MRQKNNSITKEQKSHLLLLVKEMRKIASGVGTLHSWWDDIFDIEAFLGLVKAKPREIKTAKEWIDYIEKLLFSRFQQKPKEEKRL